MKNIFCSNCRKDLVKDIKDTIFCNEGLMIHMAYVSCQKLKAHKGEHCSKQTKEKDFKIVWK